MARSQGTRNAKLASSRAADKGRCRLDEIGEMRPEDPGEVLRVLEGNPFECASAAARRCKVDVR